MVQFTSYWRRVLCETRLIFPRINGPNESLSFWVIIGSSSINEGDGYANVIYSCRKWVRPASNFIALIPSRSVSQMLANFSGLNSNRLYRSPEKQSRWLESTSSIKCEIRHFYVLVALWLQRNAQKALCTCKVVALILIAGDKRSPQS